MERPPAVTFAGALAMFYGVIAAIAFFVAMGLTNPANLLEAIFFPIFLAMFLTVAALGGAIFLAGLFVWRGSSPARWALVALFGLSAFIAASIASPIVWGIGIVNVAAAAGLVVGAGARWFDG